MPDFPVRDTGLCPLRYLTLPSVTFDRKTPVSGLKALRLHFQADFRAQKSCFFSFCGH